jgi:hypothetical protein
LIGILPSLYLLRCVNEKVRVSTKSWTKMKKLMRRHVLKNCSYQF